MKKDKVYSEVLGEPSIDKKELEKENSRFLKDSTDEIESRKILYNKVMRIEKMVYFLYVEIAFFFIMLFVILVFV